MEKERGSQMADTQTDKAMTMELILEEIEEMMFLLTASDELIAEKYETDRDVQPTREELVVDQLSRISRKTSGSYWANGRDGWISLLIGEEI